MGLISKKPVVPAGVAGAKPDVTVGEGEAFERECRTAVRDLAAIVDALDGGWAPTTEQSARAIASSKQVVDRLRATFDVDLNFTTMKAAVEEFWQRPAVETGTLALQSAMTKAKQGKLPAAIDLIHEAEALFASSLKPGAISTASTFTEQGTSPAPSASRQDQLVVGPPRDLGYGEAAVGSTSVSSSSGISERISLSDVGPISVKLASEWLANAPGLQTLTLQQAVAFLTPEQAEGLFRSRRGTLDDNARRAVVANLAKVADILVNGEACDGQVSSARFEALMAVAVGDSEAHEALAKERSIAGEPLTDEEAYEGAVAAAMAGLTKQFAEGMTGLEQHVMQLAVAIADPDNKLGDTFMTPDGQLNEAAAGLELTPESVVRFIQSRELKEKQNPELAKPVSAATIAREVFGEMFVAAARDTKNEPNIDALVADLKNAKGVFCRVGARSENWVLELQFPGPDALAIRLNCGSYGHGTTSLSMNWVILNADEYRKLTPLLLTTESHPAKEKDAIPEWELKVLLKDAENDAPECYPLYALGPGPARVPLLPDAFRDALRSKLYGIWNGDTGDDKARVGTALKHVDIALGVEDGAAPPTFSPEPSAHSSTPVDAWDARLSIADS